MENHCSWPVPLGLLHLSSLQEFLLGSLASHGWLELPSGQFLPIWYRWSSLHSHLGQLLGWWWLQQPSHHLQHLHFCPPPLHFTQGWRGLNIRHWRLHQCWEFHRCFLMCSKHLWHSSYSQGLLALPHPGHLFHLCHTGKENQPIRSQGSCVRVMWHLFLNCQHVFFEFQDYNCLICHNIWRMEQICKHFGEAAQGL